MDDDGDVDLTDRTLYMSKDNNWPPQSTSTVVAQAFSDAGNPFMHQGRPHFAIDTAASDTEGKLMINDHRARFNDPVTGRWVTRDPLGFQDSLNLYEFVKSNPTRGSDPMGLAIDGGDPTVACCNDGTCADMPEAECLALGGEPGNIGSDCSTHVCDDCDTYDTVQLTCGTVLRRGVPIGIHCDVICSTFSTCGAPIQTQQGGGTGANSSGGAGSFPGWNPNSSNGGPIWGPSSGVLPAGTCDCIWNGGSALNGIPDRIYNGINSNSNSAANLLLSCCGVPSTVWTGTGATAWWTPVLYHCGFYYDFDHLCGVVAIPLHCSVDCSDL